MGKYDFILESEEETEVELDETEAVAAIAYIAGAVDFAADGGVGAKVEAEFLQGLISGLLEEDFEEEELVELIEAFKEIIDEYGPGALYNAAYDGLPDELVSTAMAAAYGMCLVDGEVPDGAAQFLAELQESLEISDDEAEEIREQVLAIMSE